jgi:putative membrane protein
MLGAADPWTVLTTVDTSRATMIGCLAIASWGIVYVLASAQPSPRGRRWPPGRTCWFLAGIVLLLYIYGSGLEVYEDQPVVHVVQHMLVMMAVPPLLVLGAPLTLLLRSLSPRARKAVVHELRGSSLRLFSGRFAAVALAADYYLTMYLYELTPVRVYAERHSVVHALIHQYFLLCGVLFWLPVAAVDPVRFRPAAGVKVIMVAIGLPAFALLGAIEIAQGHTGTGWAYIVCGAVLTSLGLAFVGARQRRLSHSEPPDGQLRRDLGVALLSARRTAPGVARGKP